MPPKKDVKGGAAKDKGAKGGKGDTADKGKSRLKYQNRNWINI